ncbi:MAG: hypothetical protein ACHQRJ_03005 [Alphaproteobacteria bacterium]
MTEDEEKQRFYHALGLAISRWQIVEISLGHIFRFLLTGAAGSGNATMSAAARAAYYAVLNFNAKLTMTNLAFQMHSGKMTQEQRDEWKSLYNRATRKAKERNELVHFVVAEFSPPRQGCRILLIPNFVDPAAPLKTKGKDITYNYEQISQKGASFDALGKDLNQFLASLGYWGASRPVRLPKSP